MAAAIVITVFRKNVPEKYHVGWLNMMLWGGVIALALEHVAHEEVVPYPPFLTAMSSAADTATMLNEMATIGTTMLVVCVLVWVVMAFVYNRCSVNTSAPEAAVPETA
jgi:hypothetical protein